MTPQGLKPPKDPICDTAGTEPPKDPICDTPGTEPPRDHIPPCDTLGTHLPATLTLLLTRSLQGHYSQGLVPRMAPQGGVAPPLLPIQPIQGTLLPQQLQTGSTGSCWRPWRLPRGPSLSQQMAL